MMEKRKLILHCSDAGYPHSAADVYKWHVEEKGWKDIGYHKIGERDGNIADGRPWNQRGAHTKGYNQHIGYCLLGLSGDFTHEQWVALEGFILENTASICVVQQHAHFDKKKAFCAGLTIYQIHYLNSLL